MRPLLTIKQGGVKKAGKDVRIGNYGSYADEIVEDTRKGASLNKIPGGYMVALIEDLHKADDSTSVFLREMQEVNPDFKVPEELLDDSVTGSVITLVDSSFVE